MNEKTINGNPKKGARRWWLAAVGSVLVAAGPMAFAVPITLQNATADFSQSGFLASETIDGNLSGASFQGWAIDPNEGESHTIVWETDSDLTASGVSINLVQNFNLNGNGQHLIGRFRLSTTTDDRSLFADGLGTGGDIFANWSVLSNPVTSGPGGLTFATLGDESVLVGGTVPATGTYTVSFDAQLTSVTGFRLEVLTDPSLPVNGPGLKYNGNFVLTEVQASAEIIDTPEPTTLALLGLALAGLGFRAKRKKLNS